MAKTRPAGTVTVLERTKSGLTVVVVRDMIHVTWHPEPKAVAFAGRVLGSTTTREPQVRSKGWQYRTSDYVPCAWPVARNR